MSHQAVEDVLLLDPTTLYASFSLCMQLLTLLTSLLVWLASTRKPHL